jgi:hypothetical protein
LALIATTLDLMARIGKTMDIFNGISITPKTDTVPTMGEKGIL